MSAEPTRGGQGSRGQTNRGRPSFSCERHRRAHVRCTCFDQPNAATPATPNEDESARQKEARRRNASQRPASASYAEFSPGRQRSAIGGLLDKEKDMDEFQSPSKADFATPQPQRVRRTPQGKKFVQPVAGKDEYDDEGDYELPRTSSKSRTQRSGSDAQFASPSHYSPRNAVGSPPATPGGGKRKRLFAEPEEAVVAEAARPAMSAAVDVDNAGRRPAPVRHHFGVSEFVGPGPSATAAPPLFLAFFPMEGGDFPLALFRSAGGAARHVDRVLVALYGPLQAVPLLNFPQEPPASAGPPLVPAGRTPEPAALAHAVAAAARGLRGRAQRDAHFVGHCGAGEGLSPPPSDPAALGSPTRTPPPTRREEGDAVAALLSVAASPASSPPPPLEPPPSIGPPPGFLAAASSPARRPTPSPLMALPAYSLASQSHAYPSAHSYAGQPVSPMDSWKPPSHSLFSV